MKVLSLLICFQTWQRVVIQKCLCIEAVMIEDREESTSQGSSDENTDIIFQSLSQIYIIL